ncbi:sensor histidine kinase [Streptomyces sp. YC504]|uniref:histidine kinase n=1 Tax=Streptomyces mesophilus TaxID=1775132 RepID=A0A6G4XSR9_9ACTN|nr:histidine kinase [Streptomyces mesophilus]NGO79651.1 sensor histidine kinase [Streptomyces mesophilus]
MRPTSAHTAPLLRQIRPETWAVVLWFATLGFGLLTFFRLPGEAVIDGEPQPVFSPGPLGWTLLAVMSCAVTSGARLLRGRPLFGYALFLLGPAGAAGLLGMNEFDLVSFLAPAFALYLVARHHIRHISVITAAFALAVLFFPFGVRVATRGNVETAQLLSVALLVLVAWVVGDSHHQARAHAAALQTQAAAQAVTAERLRIAREMHDTVAHSIGIIALQAGAAARVVHTQPDRASEAMRTVEEAGRETLAGLRRMLGALREPGLSPLQGLSDLDQLAESTSAAGVRTAVTWQGARRPLPPDIDLAAYRLVQEAVTNVVRHAKTEACEVRVEYGKSELALEITDRGRGPGGSGGGFGLVGMRERVALLNGEFSAGARTGGGFRVAARLPLPGAAA